MPPVTGVRNHDLNMGLVTDLVRHNMESLRRAVAVHGELHCLKLRPNRRNVLYKNKSACEQHCYGAAVEPLLLA